MSFLQKYQYKYKLMCKNSHDSKFSEYMQFTFNPKDTLKEIQGIWPDQQFKVILNPNRNI